MLKNHVDSILKGPLMDGYENNNMGTPSRRFSVDQTLNASMSSLNQDSTDKMFHEKQFLLSCERGDIGSVRKLLETAANVPDSLNINCLDPLGRTALLIAIENENIEMIELLLDNNIETGDAILYAIGEENVEAVEIIVEHLEKIEKFNPETGGTLGYGQIENDETQGVEINEHSAFTPDVTPIILAAHKDNYECIKLFLDKKAAIPHPHDVQCSCDKCEQARAEDSLRLSRSRINAYRALASPSLICLSAKDPILYAFELSWELRRLSYIENEFRSEYQELSQKCQKFSVNILDQVRGSKELEIVLNHTTSAWNEVTERRPTSSHLCHQLARLKLAVQLRQKRFVAHPNCQQLLAGIWYEGVPGFRTRNIVIKILIILGISFCFPLLAIFYLFAPKSAIANFTRKPFVKFLCHSASYCFFLFLLILASQRINYDQWFGVATARAHEFDPDRKERRGPPPTPVECAIILWIIGLIWVEIKQLWDSGLREYCYNLWNILDFITNALYLCTFALRTVAFVQVGDEQLDEVVQVEAEMRDPRMQHIGRRLPRRHWEAWDPTLISECVFATANIFSSLKLVHIFTVNPHLGPLKISLGRMVIDILKFFLVYCLVLFAFACGLNQLFWYYATMRQKECDLFKELSQDATPAQLKELKGYEDSCDPKYRSCASLYHSLETLFWSTFGIIDLTYLEIYETHFPTQWTGRTIFGLFTTIETLFWAIFGLIDLSHFGLKEPHAITEWAGKTIFGSYSVCTIVVLLNVLIAMMSNSYQYISNQADVEWKFARSKLWIEYFDDTATLPPPFNMIPSPKSFYYGLQWVFERICRCSRIIQQGKQRSMRNQKILKVVNERENNYRFVTRNLVKRYIAQMQRIRQQSMGVSEDDVNEIKMDISAFRYELLDILRKAGFITGHADINQKAYSRNKKRSAMAERRLKKGLPDSFNIPMPDSFNPIAKPPASESKSSSPSNLARLNLQLKRIGKKVNFRQPSLLAGFGEKRRSIGELKSSSLDRDYDGTEPGSRRDSDTIRTAHSEGSKEELNKRERLRKQRRQSEDTVLELEGEDLLL